MRGWIAGKQEKRLVWRDEFLAHCTGPMTQTLLEPLTIGRLSDDADASHRAARGFCLDVIKEVYGFDYRADWHADLDLLCAGGPDNQYAATNQGGFWLVTDDGGGLVATIGIKRLAWQPRLLANLAARYKDSSHVATLTRAYIRQDFRGQGLGARLTRICEAAARDMGYRTIYLHTNADADAAMRFWRGQGWAGFGQFGISAHFEKHLYHE